MLICLQMDSDDSIPVMDLANQEYQVSAHCISTNDVVLFAFQHAVECVSKAHEHMHVCALGEPVVLGPLLITQIFLVFPQSSLSLYNRHLARNVIA